jgi:hypothetical protein
VIFFYVETRGPTLEEIARIFDGEDAAVGNLDMDIDTITAVVEAKEDFLHVETKAEA